MSNALDVSCLAEDLRVGADLLDGWFEHDAFRFDAPQSQPTVNDAPGLAAVLVSVSGTRAVAVRVAGVAARVGAVRSESGESSRVGTISSRVRRASGSALR